MWVVVIFLMSWLVGGSCQNPVVYLRRPHLKVVGVKLTSQDGSSFYKYIVRYASNPGRFERSKVIHYDWNETIDSSVDPPKCLQPDSSTNEVVGDEDCFFCAVFTPANTNYTKLPVAVHTHGGGFKTGPPGELNQIAKYLMNKQVGVIVVQCQYRLGPFGFMKLDDEVMLGNYGLDDACVFLDWVRKYIWKFGGDPSRITVFGESAGGLLAQLVTERCESK